MKAATDGTKGKREVRRGIARLAWVMIPFVAVVAGDVRWSARAGVVQVDESVRTAQLAAYSGGMTMQAAHSAAPGGSVSTSDADALDDDANAAPPADAAPKGGGAGLKATVSLLSSADEEIRLIKDKAAIIRTNNPIARVGIANPEIADVQQVPNAREVVITGKAFGATQLVLWSDSGEQKTFNLVVEVDVPMLNAAIRRVSPLARVDARMLSGTLVLSGRVPDPLTAERVEALAKIVHPRVANQMTVGGIQQAVLRCTVAEVNKEAVRELSMNWAIGGSEWTKDFFFANNLGQLSPTVIGSNGQANLLVPPFDGRGGNNITQTFFRSAASNSPTTNVTFGFPRAEFQVFLRALRDNNLFRILAEPNVTAVNGQEASFLSGGEFPIAVTQGGAVAGAITIEYKQFGILLRFTPTMLGNGMVRMKVIAEVSDLVPGTTGTAGGLPVFSLSTRRVESTVEVGSDQTFAIGGLLSERVQALSSKIPGLGDIPVLGAMFSSVQYQRNETELVVMVTPQLVEPMDANQVPPVPGHEMTSPDDYELYLLGQLEGKPMKSPKFDALRRASDATDESNEMAARGGGALELTLRGPFGTSDYEER